MNIEEEAKVGVDKKRIWTEIPAEETRRGGSRADNQRSKGRIV